MKKPDILHICELCPDACKANDCQIADIEAAKDEDIHPPKCTKFQSSFDETSERKAVSINEKGDIHRRETNNGARYPNEVSKSSIGGIFPLDPLDLKILNFLSIHHYERSISRVTNEKRVTIQKRIKRLREMGLIRPEEGNRHIKFYALTPSGIQFLVYDEEGTRKQDGKNPFTLHCSKWSFPIISGFQPRSKNPVKMKNWTGFDFIYSQYTIRSTPSSIHVFVNVELLGESVENLNKKYEALAICYAGKFAEDHGLKLDAPKPYQKPHFTLRDNALTKIISEVGNVRTPDIHIDKSRSDGDLEMEYKAAKGLEFSISQMPAIVAGLQADISGMKDTIPSFRADMETMKDTIKFFVESLQTLIPPRGKEKQKQVGERPREYKNQSPGVEFG
jgi:hypothetical protein